MATTQRGLLSRSWLRGMAVLAALVHLSVQQRDPIKDFCRRFGHQTALVDRKLYIDGGLVNWNSMDTDPGNYTNSWLIWHDLDTLHDGMPQIHADLNKNASIPSVHGGALWADDVNYRLFLFGGEYYSGNPTTFNLMSYDIWYDQWDNFGVPGAGIQPISYGASTSVMERGEGYYYGGYLSNASVPGWNGPPLATTGLVRYTMDGNSWTNLTGPDDIGRAEGVMTFLPVSDGGMLVYFGGVQDPYHNGTVIPQPMEQIFIYDIISNKWHIQNATGTIPEYRRKFCAGAVWANDRSSYNIYLNAGLGFGGDGFDDVYILSLPSFTWIKTYPLDRNGTGEYPSHSLSCNIVNQGSQMLAIGGTFPKDNTCDYEQVWGVHNVDLGNQIKDNFQKVWAEYVPTLIGYKVPEFVTSVIGGTEDGGATKTTPDAGFADHDIGILLGMKAEFPTRTRANDGRTAPATATATGSENSGSKSGLSQGAIIGIAVGGGVALIAILIGLWLLKRKKSAQPAPVELPAQRPPTPPPSSPYCFDQLSESRQRMSPMRQIGYGQDPDPNRSWRSSPANSPLVPTSGTSPRPPPSEMDGQSHRVVELDAGNEMMQGGRRMGSRDDRYRNKGYDDYGIAK